MVSVKFAPPRVPLVDLRTGTITREWYLLFSSLFEGLSGPGGVPDPTDDNSGTPFIPYDNRPDVIEVQTVTVPQKDFGPQLGALELLQAVQAAPQDYASRLDAVERTLAISSMYQSPDARIEALEELLAADPFPKQAGVTLGFGTYTPTLTNLNNLSASTPHVCQYLRVGNVVTVSGYLEIDPVAASSFTSLNVSLPIASTFTASEQCCGTAFCNVVSGQGAAFFADGANGAVMQLIAVSTANQFMSFSFTYRIV